MMLATATVRTACFIAQEFYTTINIDQKRLIRPAILRRTNCLMYVVPILMRAGRAVLAVASLLLACRLVAAQGLTVAAASALQSALPEMAAQLEGETGQEV